ncbi:uroporphyrinogen-III synthase [Pseudomonas duriflava]|uniref:Uroporphyrinogen-III synthase n=1 Tax=Pseudomonas duriflava TaxID=459528 RepID=A0A562QL74_9PSED|nr:uroporphyrinogen-III synthase [Pseudomonas duriflava]TWI57512.1 uroporphyrinogen-III synthase [Pseudomonas duriflava]
MTAWRLLLTRPADECAAMAAALAEKGIYSASLPLLAIEPLPETPEQRTLMLDLDRYAAVIAVSKPAARLGLERVDRYWPQPPLHQTWFAVGAATGEILETYGLSVHCPEQHEDSEGLLAHPALTAALDIPDPHVLILRGEGGREALAETLRTQGVKVDYLELYRRVLPDYPQNALTERITAERLNAVMVSSGQSFTHLHAMAGPHWPVVSKLPLFVPSARVAELARVAGAQRVITCQGASTAAVLAALEQHQPE